MNIINNKNQIEILLSSGYIFDYPNELSGKQFTKREIDLLACVLSGRTVKKIAILLSISPKTAESHIRNIGQKLGLSSQGDIIDFLEKSSRYEFLKQHYVNILIHHAFEKKIKNINIQNGHKTSIGISVVNDNKKSNMVIKQIAKDLESSGVIIELSANNNLARNNYPIIYYVHNYESNFLNSTEQTKFNTGDVIICLNYALYDLIKSRVGKALCLILSDFKSYHLFFFELLKHIFPNQSFKPHIDDFNKETNLLREPRFTPQSLEKNAFVTKSTHKTWIALGFVVICFAIFFSLTKFKIIELANNPNGMVIVRDEYANIYAPINWNLPFPNYYFTGRDKELKELINKLANKRQNYSMVTIVACKGMGGAGKTEMAKYFVHNAENISNKKYKYKFWFDSEKIDQLIEQYIRVAKTLKIKLDGLDNEEVIVKVREWFETHSNWLLVYDNAESMDSIIRFFPQRGGDILITSRNPNWRTVVNIDVMTEREAISLLKEIIGKPDDETDIKALVNMLGKLPLAVAQAGAYILKNEISVKEYLDEYGHEEHRLLSDEGMPPGNSHSSVSVTFALSIESIKQKSPDAYMLINCLAHLDPNLIYRKDLEIFMPQDNSEKAKVSLNNAIQVLRDYSLISVNKDQKIAIHRLVQLVTWHRQVHKMENSQWLYKVLDVLNDESNYVHSQLTLGVVGDKRKCLEALIDYYIRKLKVERSSVLLHSLGCCYFTMHDFKNAEKCFLESISLRKRSSIYCEYGIALFLQGKEADAIRQFEKSITFIDDDKSYFGDLELDEPSIDIAIKALVNKYGVVRITSTDLSVYFLVRSYQKLGNHKKTNLYLKQFKSIVKKSQNPVLRDLLTSIV